MKIINVIFLILGTLISLNIMIYTELFRINRKIKKILREIEDAN